MCPVARFKKGNSGHSKKVLLIEKLCVCDPLSIIGRVACPQYLKFPDSGVHFLHFYLIGGHNSPYGCCHLRAGQPHRLWYRAWPCAPRFVCPSQLQSFACLHPCMARHPLRHPEGSMECPMDPTEQDPKRDQESQRPAQEAARRPSLTPAQHFERCGSRDTEGRSSLGQKTPRCAGSGLLCRKRLGAGGYGTVHVWLNADTQDLVAVKKVPLNTGCRHFRERLQLLQDQIDVLRALAHPNLVPYLHTSREGPCLDIAAVYVPLGSVAQRLQEGGPLPPRACRRCCSDVLRGLAYLHRRGHVHGALKGANVLLRATGACGLGDYGTAALLDGLVAQDPRAAGGGPQWMAPEVMLRTGHSWRADIWGLGCLVMEMLTAAPPWAHVTREERAVMHFVVDPQRALTLPHGLAPGAAEFLRGTLRRRPEQRPAARHLMDHPFLRRDDGPRESDAGAAAALSLPRGGAATRVSGDSGLSSRSYSRVVSQLHSSLHTARYHEEAEASGRNAQAPRSFKRMRRFTRVRSWMQHVAAETALQEIERERQRDKTGQARRQREAVKGRRRKKSRKQKGRKGMPQQHRVAEDAGGGVAAPKAVALGQGECPAQVEGAASEQSQVQPPEPEQSQVQPPEPEQSQVQPPEPEQSQVQPPEPEGVWGLRHAEDKPQTDFGREIFYYQNFGAFGGFVRHFYSAVPLSLWNEMRPPSIVVCEQ